MISGARPAAVEQPEVLGVEMDQKDGIS